MSFNLILLNILAVKILNPKEYMDNFVNIVTPGKKFLATSKSCSGPQRPGQAPVKAETQDWREVSGRERTSCGRFTKLTGEKYSTSALDWPGRSLLKRR